MKKSLFIFFLFFTTTSWGNGISVSNVNFNSSTNQLSYTLEWQNSWTYLAAEPHLWDAAWVFIKYAPNGGDNWLHAPILDSVPILNYAQFISYDDLGIMIFKSTDGVGTFVPQQFTVELAPLLGAYQDFKVFATEMVYIDDGDFNAGDGSSSGRFHRGNNVNAPLIITSEDPIMRGNGPGDFGQEGSTATADLSAQFPKGHTSFYCMKYKITAEQYVDFLNCLTRGQQNSRVQANLSGTTASNKYVMTNTASPTDRNPIACDVAIGTGSIEFYLDLDDTNSPNSPNDGANIVLNHITASDIIAYMDWSGLRPLSELEFEKVCRGNYMPVVAGEFAWGTDTRNNAGVITNPGANNEATANVGILDGLYQIVPLRAGYAATSSSSRVDAGGTFWGVMDIHNLGEFMYGVESLNFDSYAYGDGNLDSFGNAIVPEWTVGAQLFCSEDPSAPVIEPISQGKNVITPLTRSAYMGARGMRKLIQQ